MNDINGPADVGESANLDIIAQQIQALKDGHSDECYVCGQTITGMCQIGHLVYAVPCMCQLWKGHVPARWKQTHT